MYKRCRNSNEQLLCSQYVLGRRTELCDGTEGCFHLLTPPNPRLVEIVTFWGDLTYVSKLHYLIYELYLTNHLSFLELLNCGTHCHPLLSLNPTICHLLNLTSTNLILSPFLLKLPIIFSVFPFSGLCYRPYGLSPTLLNRNKHKHVDVFWTCVQSGYPSKYVNLSLHFCLIIIFHNDILFSRDRKRKKFVGASNDKGGKRIKTESGAWIKATYKSNKYPFYM